MTKIMRFSLILIAMFFFSISLTAAPNPVGIVRSVNNDVKIKSTEGGDKIPKVGDQVFKGDVITTGKEGKIKILFTNDNILILGFESSVTIDELAYNPETKESQSIFSLITGKVRAIVKKLLTPSSQFKIKTANSDIGVLGTIFIATYDDKAGILMVFTESGEVQIDSHSKKWEPFKLGESFFTRIEKEANPDPAKPLKGIEVYEPIRHELTIYEDINPKQPDDVKGYIEGGKPAGQGEGENTGGTTEPSTPENPTVPPIQQEPLTGRVKVKVITNFP